MSGRKCSEFSLQRERAEKLRLLQGLGNLHAEVNGLRERVTDLCDEASEGLRATFAEDVQQAQHWLAQGAPAAIRGLGMDTDLTTLRMTHAALEQTAVRGRQAQEVLTLAFSQKADEMGQRLARQLTEVERQYIGYQHLLRLWCGERQTQQWEHALQEARHLLGEERYTALERLLEETAKEMSEKTEWAAEQEDKYQKRLYLLKALRQVCAEMGFEEVTSPRYEREGDRGSRISFAADTLDRGQIAFTLSLDDISSVSEIVPGHCFEEFGQLSQYLEDEFGIHTQFRLAEGEPIRQLIRKGELDVPEDAGMQQEA